MNLFNDLFAFIKDDELGNPRQLAIEDDSGSAGRNKKSDIKFDKSGGRKKKVGRYSCCECDFKSDQKKSIQIHTDSIHLGILRFFCKDCDYKCYRKCHMMHHMKSKHNNENNTILRIGCDKCVNSEEHDECHIASKNQEYTGIYSCNECEYKSNRKQSILIHTDIKHLKIVRFICQDCNFKCYSKSRMRSHMQAKHKNESGKILRVGCEKCVNGADHEKCDNVKSRGGVGAQYSCNECEFKSDFKSSIKAHTEILHLGKMKFFCKECDYKCYFKPGIVKHMKRKHNNENGKICRINCDKCVKREEHDNCENHHGIFL